MTGEANPCPYPQKEEVFGARASSVICDLGQVVPGLCLHFPMMVGEGLGGLTLGHSLASSDKPLGAGFQQVPG